MPKSFKSFFLVVNLVYILRVLDVQIMSISVFFFLILINELCKIINSTNNLKSWKLKKENTLDWAFWKKNDVRIFMEDTVRKKST
jgi:hypothetical protein